MDVLPSRGHLLVTGDLHDNPFNLQRITEMASLNQSVEHHVLFQEMIHGDNMVNGMDLSVRRLLYIAVLLQQYPGQVHPVIANHELSQMTGRAVSKGAGNSVDQFNSGLEYLYGNAWVDVCEAMNTFIGSMALALRSESGLLCAHSLPDAERMDDFDPGIISRPLEAQDYEAPRGAVHVMTWGRRYTEDSIAVLRERWDVRLFCLGHRYVPDGIMTFSDSVIILNSDHAAGRVLPVDLGALPAARDALNKSLPIGSPPAW